MHTLTRRELLSAIPIGAAAAVLPRVARTADIQKPVVVSTWNFGLTANKAAWEILGKEGRALDAVEAGARVPEADPKIQSVGLGGYPDRDGIVTLDACIMDENGNAGSVGALEDIIHAVSVARRVMEKTPHVMLVGPGARDFAMAEGFPKENLLTEESRKAWEKWKVEHSYKPKEWHDTIGILALDTAGNLSGACTTSGLAWKYHGRVGDSPIVGAGLFVDNEVGGACSTGKGEAVMKIAGSHTVVELMRRGASPTDACREAVERIANRQHDYREFQVAFLALNKRGESGAFAIAKGFEYARTTASGGELIAGASLI
ncbi:MAG: N(4)-(beta-N-acetylglucosaminyl)-L-asparaginase [Bacteroidota bacterium]|nr:N(4)-(beta-N-acetylglucosaminyl)-L-asparaginase [Bacteroidota bacterium]MDP4243336.1 N(4)-(beta-N-acetylglucosaminyl)-L-asparaginase [Bacteroidota bacterium]MDP4288022.1 N(4)-(beta-N-acetylglucosaminyl)-L-asparaginase [Bacteroidota bacterium]